MYSAFLTQRARFLYMVVLMVGLSIQPALSQEASDLYQNYCAGCHGSRLQGGSATALVKTEWEYGRSRGMIVRNITYGIDGSEMGAWRNLLDGDQIQVLADFIVQAQEMPISAVRDLPEALETELYTIDVEQVAASGIETPWAIAFADDAWALVTERKGQIRLLENGVLNPQPIKATPEAFKTPFCGYMGIAVDPAFEENGWVYLAYCESLVDQSDRTAPGMLKVVRGRIQDHTWTDQEILFEAPEALHIAGGNRWGGRLAFDKEGYLYFGIGDLAVADASQDPFRVPGKTFRIHADGAIPEDNPYANQPGAVEAIYTLGNRNTQGFAVHPETGAVWSTDHGPMGGDEVNVLINGGNFGWPEVTHGIDYNGDIVSDETEKEGMIPPVLYWTPSIAVSSATFVDGRSFSSWENNLLVGALAYEEVRRLVVEGGAITHQETLFRGYGRVRDVQQSPDGSIFVLLNEPDKIIRLVGSD